MTVFGKKSQAKVLVEVSGPILKADGDHLLIRRDADSGEWVRLEVRESQKLFVGVENRRYWCVVGGVQCVRLTSHTGVTGLFKYVR